MKQDPMALRGAISPRAIRSVLPSLAVMLLVFLCGIFVGTGGRRGEVDTGVKPIYPKPGPAGAAPAPETDFALYFVAPLLPLTDKTTDRQVHAIHSWTQLVPRPHIFLATENITDFRVFKSIVGGLTNVDDSYIELAEVEWIEFDDPRLTKVRLPVLTSILATVQRKALLTKRQGMHPIFTYVNSDIFLYEEFARAARRIAGLGDFKRYLMVGERMEYDYNSSTSKLSLGKLREATLDASNYRGRWAIDYFTFGPETWSHIPRFVIGRPRFDNWLVANARGVRVDATRAVVAMHTIHDYTHAGANNTNILKGWKSPIIEEMNPGRMYNEKIIQDGHKDDVYYREGSLDHICLKIKPSKPSGFCFFRVENDTIGCSPNDLNVYHVWTSGARGNVLCGGDDA